MDESIDTTQEFSSRLGDKFDTGNARYSVFKAGQPCARDIFSEIYVDSVTQAEEVDKFRTCA